VRRLLLVSTVSLLLAGPASTQSPQKSTATFDDWTVSCVFDGETKKQACEIIQVQMLPEQAAPVSQITIGAPTTEKLYKILIQVPANIWIPNGVKLAADEKDSGSMAAFRWCVSTRCLADMEVKEEIIRKLQAGGTGRLSFKDSSQADFVIAVSFKGLPDALSYMGKQK
jgi:invasion protein IalB